MRLQCPWGSCCLVAQLHLHDPVAEGVLIDQLGLVLKGLVDLNDRTGDGAHQVAGGLDALHGTEIVLGGELVIYLRHIDIDDIAQALLCVVGDTYIGLVALNLHILVALAVVEPFNYFCHSFCY